jgi:drug/metabolite transporter (DMT)-like permease
MKTYAVLALAIFVQATGNVCLSKGMKELSLASSIFALFFQAIGSPVIWIGTALLFLFFLLFVAALSWADLSFVVPAISIEVVVNVAFADYFLNEPVTSVRWIGTLLISTGVILVLRSRR